MEAAIDQVIIVMSSILILINARICFDLAYTLWKKYDLSIVWLTLMFGSFVLVGVGGLVAVNILSAPTIYRILMLVTLILAVLGTYNTLRSLNREK